MFRYLLPILTLLATPTVAFDARTILDQKSFKLIQEVGYSAYPFGRPIVNPFEHDLFRLDIKPQTIFAYFDFDASIAKLSGARADRATLKDQNDQVCTQVNGRGQYCFTIQKRGNNFYLTDRGQRAYFLKPLS